MYTHLISIGHHRKNALVFFFISCCHNDVMIFLVQNTSSRLKNPQKPPRGNALELNKKSKQLY